MAKDNFSVLNKMIYSGRGITVGKTPSGTSFIGYSLTGRSSSSQARGLVGGLNTRVIRTDVTDPEQLRKGSPALLLYPAIMPVGDNTLVASNGAQTKLLYNQAKQSRLLLPESLIKRSFREPFFEYDEKEDRLIDITTYEPDAPNNTPRISAHVKENIAIMNIIWEDKGKKKYETFSRDLFPGKGKLITTYSGGNEKPLAPFQGNPLDVEIGSETAQGIVENIYEAMHGGQTPDDNYRVAAAVAMLKPGGLETAIINRVGRGD